MKRMLIITIVFAGVTLALLFAMSVRSFAGDGPPPTPDCNTACVGPVGQVNLACCETDDDCQGADSHGWVCMTLPGGGAGDDDDGDDVGLASCPSIIGGSGDADDVDVTYAPFFFRGPSQANFNTAERRNQQSVEVAGSLRNLNVLLHNPNDLLDNMGSNPCTNDCTLEFIVRVDDNGLAMGVSPGDTTLKCTIDPNAMNYNGSCTNLSDDDCIAVPAGSLISLKAHPTADTGSNTDGFNFTAVFDPCQPCPE